ncbi:MAG TPA: hypothetical protein VFP52_06870 [Myxococcales bacterium]|nr:hypothetical protein [Myxococcales bacterium]
MLDRDRQHVAERARFVELADRDEEALAARQLELPLLSARIRVSRDGQLLGRRGLGVRQRHELFVLRAGGGELVGQFCNARPGGIALLVGRGQQRLRGRHRVAVLRLVLAFELVAQGAERGLVLARQILVQRLQAAVVFGLRLHGDAGQRLFVTLAHLQPHRVEGLFVFGGKVAAERVEFPRVVLGQLRAQGVQRLLLLCGELRAKRFVRRGVLRGQVRFERLKRLVALLRGEFEGGVERGAVPLREFGLQRLERQVALLGVEGARLFQRGRVTGSKVRLERLDGQVALLALELAGRLERGLVFRGGAGERPVHGGDLFLCRDAHHLGEELVQGRLDRAAQVLDEEVRQLSDAVVMGHRWLTGKESSGRQLMFRPFRARTSLRRLASACWLAAARGDGIRLQPDSCRALSPAYVGSRVSRIAACPASVGRAFRPAACLP